MQKSQRVKTELDQDFFPTDSEEEIKNATRHHKNLLSSVFCGLRIDNHTFFVRGEYGENHSNSRFRR